MNRLFKFINPNWRKAILFALLIILMPVPILIREPLSQINSATMVWKYHVSESLFTLFAGGHASGFDVFLGAVAGFYFSNLLGLPLLLIYYLTACAVSFLFKVRN